LGAEECAKKSRDPSGDTWGKRGFREGFEKPYKKKTTAQPLTVGEGGEKKRSERRKHGQMGGRKTSCFGFFFFTFRKAGGGQDIGD